MLIFSGDIVETATNIIALDANATEESIEEAGDNTKKVADNMDLETVVGFADLAFGGPITATRLAEKYVEKLIVDKATDLLF